MAGDQTSLAALNDEELITLVRQGREAAFEILYERYNRRLLVFFYRLLGQDDGKAQDFLQEIFMKIVEKPHYFNGRAQFSTWIFKIAHNMVKNEYRRLNVRKIVQHEAEPDDYAGSEDLDAALDAREFHKRLHLELSKLDTERQSTFLLRFQEQFSIKEISEVLGCSEGTVKSRLFYTARHLADKLKAFSPKG